LKIRNKITLLFTLLVTAILLVLNISIYYLTSVETKEVFRKRLKSRASNNAQIFEYFGDSSVNMLRRIDGGSLALLPQKTVAIYDTTGHLLYHYQAADADTLLITPAQLEDMRTSGEEYLTIGTRDVIGLYYPGARRSFIVVVAADNEDGRQRLSELKQILIVSLLIGMLVTLVTGYVFSSQLVRPISAITKEVNAISSHNLSKRLATGISQDELNQLAKTFNDLLDRLQDSFNTQRRFISHASHELSTPLTSISSQLQVTLQNERSPVEYQRVMQSIMEDVEQMRQLTKSLLEIARAGSQGSIELNELRIDELLLKIIADVKRGNYKYEVELQFHDLPEDENQCRVFGNFDLLYSAIKNIIENGCKYSPDKTSVVEVAFTEMNIIIKVFNKGDVIIEQEIEQIFQPFFRGGNAADTKGFGLGLPLANRIITLHKGEINVESGLKGTVFTITLPSLVYNKTQF
jgi:two-component system, OmpR family, sensor histidine kinase ArlS